MLESFVEVRYQDVELSRRAKLCHVTAHHGYLEVALPMPVGTIISLTTDEKVSITATVTRIHEQIAGAAQPPGMLVAPHFAQAEALSWWAARVTEADSRQDPALPSPNDTTELAANHPVVDDGRSTTVMKAVEVDAIVAAGQLSPTEAATELDTEQSGSLAEAGTAKKKTRRSKRRIVT
jgi:hypothetical protein